MYKLFGLGVVLLLSGCIGRPTDFVYETSNEVLINEKYQSFGILWSVSAGAFRRIGANQDFVFYAPITGKLTKGLDMSENALLKVSKQEPKLACVDQKNEFENCINNFQYKIVEDADVSQLIPTY